jgi:hypothetical protein
MYNLQVTDKEVLIHHSEISVKLDVFYPIYSTQILMRISEVCGEGACYPLHPIVIISSEFLEDVC